MGGALHLVMPFLLDAVMGVVVGGLVLAVVTAVWGVTHSRAAER